MVSSVGIRGVVLVFDVLSGDMRVTFGSGVVSLVEVIPHPNPITPKKMTVTPNIKCLCIS